ncbi:MAG: hypothetical protein RLZZ65_588 [Bacteroidota bacterium]|jgi:hypothetical protein
MPHFSLKFLLVFCLCPLAVEAQILDDFQDHDFSHLLQWNGDTAHCIINASGQLQLNISNSDSTTLWLQKPNCNIDTLSFQFWLRENFSPSSLNFGRFFISADQANINEASNALYLQFGESGSSDAIRLFYRYSGQDSLLNSSSSGSIAYGFSKDLRFLYTSNHYQLLTWSLDSNTYELLFEGDMPYLNTDSYCGFYFLNTSSNGSNFYLDDFYFGCPLHSTADKIIFTEIMADPDSLLGLPDAEYLEIYNQSNFPISLKGFRLLDATGTCTLPSFWLLPQAYVGLVGTHQSSAFQQGNLLEVSAFPSLNNAGEFIQLFNRANSRLDAVAYSESWHADTLTDLSGYSLERRSLADPCSNQDNWGTSQAIYGGSPGAQNSINDNQPDLIAPQQMDAEVLDAHYVSLHFSEPIDSLSLSLTNIQLLPDLGAFQRFVFTEPNSINGAQCLLCFPSEIQPSKPIEIQLASVADCWQNTSALIANCVRYETPEKGDVIINEILFDPPNNGHDFVELYNHSDKYLTFKNCGIANATDSVLLHDVYLKPKSYLALCPDTNFLLANYPQAAAGHLFQCSLPYFYNDSGTCILFNEYQRIDSLHYTAKWHFPLLIDTEGISLERLNANQPTQDAQNWFSAASLAGGATPGAKNSQNTDAQSVGEISLSFQELSPDADGYHDQLEINYQMKAPGMFAQVEIYTPEGVLIQKILTNESIGSTGFLHWNGTTSFNMLAPSGIYVLWFRAFSTNPGVFFSKKIVFSVCYKT